VSPYTFHITPYDLLFQGTIFIGLTFTLLLWFTKRINQTANRFLALALGIVVLWVIWVLGIDVGLGAYFPRWSWLPLQFSLTFGPLIYFYVLKMTRPEYKFGWKDLLHFSPLLLQQGVLVLEVRESIRTGAATYDTLTFQQLSPALQLLAFISVIIYLYWSYRRIQDFYQRRKFNGNDRYRNELRWLHRLLTGFGLLWLLWIPFTAVDYFYYHYQLGLHAYYPLYLLLAITTIRVTAVAFLRPEAGTLFAPAPSLKPPLPVEIKQRGIWLKRAVQTGLYYQDPELSLSALAEKLELTTHELSRIINTALKKSFNDFINEYRVAEVVLKMQDPAFDHITLLGIAYESGFNSQSTFTRTFKHMTGKSPLEYKNDLKKNCPSYNLGSHQQFAPVVLHRETTTKWSDEKLNRNYMFKNYLKIAWRNLLSNKAHSLINITGLSVGMAVAILIGLWVWDELSFNKRIKNYDHLAQVMQNQNFNGEIGTQSTVPYVLGNALKNSYGSDFKNVSMASWTDGHILAIGDRKISKTGNFFEPQIIDMFSINMLKGTRKALYDNHSIILSSSTVKALFGNENPMDKTIKIDNSFDVKVTGVYEDFPYNTDLNDLTFIAPWQLFIDNNSWPEKTTNPWRNNSFQTVVQLAGNTDFDKVSAKIKDVRLKNITVTDTMYKPQVFLHPMSKWHLYSEFKNGRNVGGRIEFVWLFGIIGFFVLLLACINFMNLSTAQSEKRAKEVGIRKTIGSTRRQLIFQFFSESFLIVAVASISSLFIIWVALPTFNDLSNKKIDLPLSNPLFYLAGIVFSIITGFIAGSYPAFFLSSFKPIKVLKGTFKAGRLASLPRKSLVVIQFTVSVILIIGTIVVYRQIEFSKNRPVGYTRAGLIMASANTDEIHKHFDVVRNELKSSGAIAEIAESSSPATGLYEFDGFTWGENSGSKGTFAWVGVSYDFGKTVGWHIKEGRDFSRDFPSDSTAYVVNEAAITYTGLKDPIGKIIKDDGRPHQIIGVVENMVMESPYQPVSQTIFALRKRRPGIITVRINPSVSTHKAIEAIKHVFEKYNPSQPFDYKFIDEEYAKKFGDEERVGKLAGVFAAVAIFISCLGLFGLASFVAEQRTKEIGIRKVLGASIVTLWQLLTKEFALLVVISLIVAIPVSYYFMHNWLQNYQYRAELSWWIFVAAGAGALLITLLTVSFQSIKAALMNPVKSLRSE